MHSVFQLCSTSRTSKVAESSRWSPSFAVLSFWCTVQPINLASGQKRTALSSANPRILCPLPCPPPHPTSYFRVSRGVILACCYDALFLAKLRVALCSKMMRASCMTISFSMASGLVLAASAVSLLIFTRQVPKHDAKAWSNSCGGRGRESFWQHRGALLRELSVVKSDPGELSVCRRREYCQK